MRVHLWRSLAAMAAMCLATASVSAQQGSTPTPDQARAMLRGSPELIAQLQQRLARSGMSADQIRARLRAQGYPDNLLDQYMPGAAGGAMAPSADVFAAVQELGIADSADVSMLRAMDRERSDYARDSLEHERIRRAMRADSAEARAQADSGYNIFGLDIFLSADSRFDANRAGPVDANYRLNAGDRLVLILTGDVEQAYTLDVTREGFIVVPQVGQLYVANLTLAQLDELLYARLGRVFSGVRRGAGATTRFSVSVSRLRSNQVFVLGDVKKPGSYQVASTGTALTALYAAGGPTANGSMRRVQIRRGGQVVSMLDLYDYLLRGDARNDPRLENGDIVFVPAHAPRARILGEVVRPGTYEVTDDETLDDILAAAGGLKSNASLRRIQIERVLPAEQRAEGRERVTLDVAADGDGNGAAGRTLVKGGDVIRVFPVANRIRNTIAVEGNVWSPGRQGLMQGMRISDALRAAGGLKPDVYLGQVLVSRLRPDSTRVQMRAALRDTSGAVLNDFALQEDDVIQVFSLTDFRPERYVAIGGAVRKSGQYPYHIGMTLRDLVLMAGGLKESAYLREAEVARLPSDRTGAATAVTIRVALDSSYVFERRPGEPYLGAPGIATQAAGAPEFPLQPYDNVMVMQQPNWELQRVVTVTGEVRFPGAYALKTRDERLSDIIQRAGGFTSEAYPEGTVFTRARDSVGRVAIDVPQAMRRRNSPDNLLLVDGDRIVIPRSSGVVTVQGAVNAPNVVAYVPGKDVDYYVSQAGGPTRKADDDRAYVTQPSGKRETKHSYWLFPDVVPKPKPGSTITVPERDASDRLSWVAAAGPIAQMTTSLVALLLAIKQF